MNQDLDEWKFYYCSKGKTRDEKKILNLKGKSKVFHLDGILMAWIMKYWSNAPRRRNPVCTRFKFWKL